MQNTRYIFKFFFRTLRTTQQTAWTRQQSGVFCRVAHLLFSTSQFSLSPSLSLSAFLSLFFFCLTGCHHLFSQSPTTSYSATTDLNTDLASSVPLRRERERYTQPPPAMLQGENFACLISLPAAGVHLVISSRFFLYTFCLSADQQHDWKTLLLAQRMCRVRLDYLCFRLLILNVVMVEGGRLRLGNSLVWSESGLLMGFRCVIIQLVLLSDQLCRVL